MLTVFLELRSRKTARFLKQIMSTDKYPCIVSREMETIVYIVVVMVPITYYFSLKYGAQLVHAQCKW